MKTAPPGASEPGVTYEQGGYETAPDFSNFAPEAKAVLMAALRKLLVPD